MHTSGGRISIVINGSAYSARGELKINPSRIQTTVEANQDGTIYKTVKPQPAMAECSFDRFVNNTNGQPLVWDDNLLLLNNLAATFIERDTGITHLLTNATFAGDPSLNTATGELDGLKICADTYTSLAA